MRVRGKGMRGSERGLCCVGGVRGVGRTSIVAGDVKVCRTRVCSSAVVRGSLRRACERVRRAVLRLTLLAALGGGAERRRLHAVGLSLSVLAVVSANLPVSPIALLPSAFVHL